jgi:hypothetical protein
LKTQFALRRAQETASRVSPIDGGTNPPGKIDRHSI